MHWRIGFTPVAAAALPTSSDITTRFGAQWWSFGMTPHDLRSPDYVARRLGISIRTLERKRADGSGPRFVKAGRIVRYTDPDVDAWIASQTVASTSEARHV
jgi:predicted DNA-binding transcriptional regulator AlpA